MNFIWATRGRVWGFQFLRDGGFCDPLPAYDQAFSQIDDDPEFCRRVDDAVALKFPDPLGRCDDVGRVIPHEFVVYGRLADDLDSVEDGRNVIWPLVAEEYERLWDLPSVVSALPPSADAANWPAPKPS